MPKIYVKNTTLGNEKCIILEGREGLIYPLQFKNWLRVKVAMYYSIVPNSGDDNQSCVGGVSEVLPVHDVRDRFFLGLKSSQSISMPGEDGEYFWGNIGGPNTTVNPGLSRLSDIGPGAIYPGSVHINSSVTQPLVPNASVTSNFGAFMGVELDKVASEVSNTIYRPGQIALNYRYRANATSITNVSKEALRTEVLGNDFTLPSDKEIINENEEPQALFLYWPFFNYRLRVHSIGAFQVA